MAYAGNDLGTLTNVDVRKIWPKEDRDFTPWLLENSERLAEALGVDLELHEAEHSVGSFSLDLVGQILGTDEIVIVENQLEQSDHTHLGQIMTYAGGTDARIVVWVAPRFREEHRSALDWLNENTVEGVKFFAVEISAVRIGDSQPAPLFTVVAKPNNWGRAIKASAQAVGKSEREMAFRDFWAEYLTRVRAEYPTWTKASGDYYQSWLALPAGITRMNYSTFFSRTVLLSALETQDAGHELFAILESHKDAFEKDFGGELMWEEIEGRKACKILVKKTDVDLMDRAEWPNYVDWLVDTQARLRVALAKQKSKLVRVETTD